MNSGFRQTFLNGRPFPGELPELWSLPGPGLFETMRVRKSDDGRICVIGFNLHMERLRTGCAELSLPFSLDDLYGPIEKAVSLFAREDLPDARLRTVILKHEWYVHISEWHPVFDAEKGISLCTVTAERGRPELKSTAAGVCRDARRSAEENGYDEALLVDRSGIVREGAWSNFFWFDGEGTLCTPAQLVLPGVTRQLVINAAENMYRVRMEDKALEDILRSATEAFITQSTHGVVGVRSINGNYLMQEEGMGRRTGELRGLYEALAFSEDASEIFRV